MLIGISGKMHSGKDLVGKIIQYLTSENGKKGLRSFESSKNKTDKDGYGYANFSNYNSPFSIHKFASGIKDTVCILIGCSRKDLEDDDFKDKELGEEWRVWKFNKDLYTNEKDALDYAKLHYSYVKVYPEKYEKTFDEVVKLSVTTEVLTPRKLLTLVGTDCGRNIIHPNIWVNATMSNYKEESIIVGTQPNVESIHLEKVYPDWVITDLRFPNELKAIKDRGGFAIRLIRPLNLRFPKEWAEFEESGWCQTFENFNSFLKQTYPKLYKSIMHESETSLDSCTGEDIKYAINADGTKEDLLEKVKLILKKENII